MQLTSHGRRRSKIVSLLVAAFVAGCGGPGLTTAAPSGLAPNPATLTRAAQNARSGELLYVSGVFENTVDVYTYPQGKLVRTLTGFNRPGGLCVDRSGNVWVTDDGAQTIREYAHGGKKPIDALVDSGEDPISCAVDPTTGNLAVANNTTFEGDRGSVLIFTNASGEKTSYSVPNMQDVGQLAYDGSGNLFVDGNDTQDAPVYAVLPAGASSFESVTLNKSLDHPSGVEWLGNTFAIGSVSNSSGNGEIDEVSLSGSQGTVTKTISLTSDNQFVDFWLTGTTLIVPNTLRGTIGFYSYPAGGSPTKSITGPDGPFGVAISP